MGTDNHLLTCGNQTSDVNIKQQFYTTVRVDIIMRYEYEANMNIPNFLLNGILQ